ncbi:MAG: DUF2723 domain-containing protein, partial [Treponema sp.]|nr:DUF2723 domain-containing protein [Treponema sp.]
DPSQVARMVNFMSALLSAATILFLFWTISHLGPRRNCFFYFTCKSLCVCRCAWGRGTCNLACLQPKWKGFISYAAALRNCAWYLVLKPELDASSYLQQRASFNLYLDSRKL